MLKTLLQYQKVYNIVTKRLKENPKVLAVMVFGSMVSGDLWEQSDIDFFVIIDDDMDKIKDIYITENNIPVHIKLMNKEYFFYIHDSEKRGGFLHRILYGSKLVFSRDFSITSKFDNLIYYPDIDREKWNLVYVGNFIKTLDICKKYTVLQEQYTSYSSAIKCAEEFARLYVNSSGYMINNDVISMAVNMNDEYKEHLDRLFYEKGNEYEAMETLIKFMEQSVSSNIKNITRLLLKFMEEKKCFLSASEIKEDELFGGYDIKFEDILNKLFELKIIKKSKRDYKTEDGILVFSKENVYSV